MNWHTRSRQNHKKEVRVVGFPEIGSEFDSAVVEEKEASVQKASTWKTLADAARQSGSRTERFSSQKGAGFQRAAFDALEKVAEPPVIQKKPVKEPGAVKPVSEDLAVPEESPKKSPPAETTQEKKHTPEVDPAAVQKVLDEMFQKGLEQGRQEGRDGLLADIQSQAHQEGFQKGEQAGSEQGFLRGLNRAEQEIAKRLATVDALYNEIKEQQKVLEASQIKLAAQLLEKILMELLRSELTRSPEQIEHLVQESVALMDAGDQEMLRVYLHPDDMQWVAPLADSGRHPMRLFEDARLLQGGCRIESYSGDMGVRVESRLQAAINHLRELLLDQPEQLPPVSTQEIVDSFSVRPSSAAKPKSINSGFPDDPRVRVAVEQADKADIEEYSAGPAAFSFAPDADEVSDLGAWGGLGQ